MLHFQALAQVNLLIQAKHKELEEYNNLIHQLEELPKKRSAAVMVSSMSNLLLCFGLKGSYNSLGK